MIYPNKRRCKKGDHGWKLIHMSYRICLLCGLHQHAFWLNNPFKFPLPFPRPTFVKKGGGKA